MAEIRNTSSLETSILNREPVESWIHKTGEIDERGDHASERFFKATCSLPPHTTLTRNDVNRAGLMTDDEPFWQLCLHKAAFQGNWDIAKPIIEKYGDVALYAKITPASETMLHIALSQKNCTNFVKKLLEIMTPKSLEETDGYGKTALATAAIAGNIRAARILVSLNQTLTNIPNHKCFGLTPLHYAAKCGQKEMVRYLYKVTHEEILTGKSGLVLLKFLIAASYYDTAHTLLLRFPELVLLEDEDDRKKSAFQILAQRPQAFASGNHLGYWDTYVYNCSCLPLLFLDTALKHKRISNSELVAGISVVEKPTKKSESIISGTENHKFPKLILKALDTFHQMKVVALLKLLRLSRNFQQIHDLKKVHTEALELLKCMCQQLNTGASNAQIWKLLEIPLRAATKLGIHEVVDEILRLHPGLIWSRDRDNNHSIFHLAVLYRCEKLFGLVYRMGLHNHPISGLEDDNSNNILHLAAMLNPRSFNGAALHVQREIQWFKEVERCVPPLDCEVLNIHGKTPRMVFDEEHSQLLAEGEKWMRDKAENFSVVAALILTVMFAAIFTAPGGNDNFGRPNFLNQTSFIVFTIADAMGLFFSSSSVLMFLGILTSNYRPEDFLDSLPKMLIYGLISLFLSIASMMVAFCAALYTVLDLKGTWFIAALVLLAFVPVSLSARSLYSLLFDMVLSTKGLHIAK